MLTQSRLKELLYYDPATGVFTWRVRGKGIAHIGAVAGCVNKAEGQGYVWIGVDRKKHRAHKLAFLYMTGNFPENDTDHINRDRTDNRWENLREATQSQNNINGKTRCDNTSGQKGVCFDAKNNKWRATIGVNGKQKWLGRHAEKDDAIHAYKAAAQEIYGEFAIA